MKILHIIFVLLTLSVISCNYDEVINEEIENGTDVREPGSKEIRLSLVVDSITPKHVASTYATENGTTAENAIKNIRVIFTKSDNTTIVKSVDITSVPTPSGVNGNTYNLLLVLSPAEALDAKNVYVIANYDGTPGLGSSQYTTALTTEPLAPSVGLTSTYIPMSGALSSSAPSSHDFENSTSFTIYMKRTMAKLRIHTKKGVGCPAGLEVHWDEIKCTILNVPNKVGVWGPNSRDIATVSSVSYFNYVHSTQRREPGFDVHTSSTPKYTIIDSCYINENYRADASYYNSSNTTILRITIPSTLSVGGYSYPKKTDVYDIPINGFDGNKIERNHIYDLTVNIIGQSDYPTIFSTISDWNDVDLGFNIEPMSTLTFSKSNFTLCFNPFTTPVTYVGDTIFFQATPSTTKLDVMKFVYRSDLPTRVPGLDTIPADDLYTTKVEFADDTHSKGWVIVNFNEDTYKWLGARETGYPQLYYFEIGFTFYRKIPVLLQSSYAFTSYNTIRFGEYNIYTPWGASYNTPDLPNASGLRWSRLMGYTSASDTHDTALTPPIDNVTGCSVIPGTWRVPTIADAERVYTYAPGLYYVYQNSWISDEGDMEGNNKDLYAKKMAFSGTGYTSVLKTAAITGYSMCINSAWSIWDVK